MKAKDTSNYRADNPLDKERDLSKLRRLGRLGELGKVVSPEALDPRNIRVDVSIKLDADVLEWFKAQAAGHDSTDFRTLINSALRERMERDSSMD